MLMGLPESISSCMEAMYPLIPEEKARTRAMPIIPMEPAKPTIVVLPFLEIRFLAESLKAVASDIFAFSERLFFSAFCIFLTFFFE